MTIISGNQEILSIGRYDRCWVSKIQLSTQYVLEDDIDPSLMQLFRASDKQIMILSNANLPNQLEPVYKVKLKEEEGKQKVAINFHKRVEKNKKI